jgi:hypothetical protein
MSQTSRERVTRCLRFEYPDRLPREMWILPWASNRFPAEIAAIHQRYPGDMGGPAWVNRPSSRAQGDPYVSGESTDEWGCVFTSIQTGVFGEVRNPILPELANWRSVLPPYETLPEDYATARDMVNRSCAESTMFVRAPCCPRPWERLQFIRGSVNAMMDVMEQEDDLHRLLTLMQDFYMKEMEFWVTTDVDAVGFMDDWGSQQQLLIPPPIWRDLFKPLYRDYCDLAHAHGKFVFMHSDGMIAEIYDDLIEIGVDALNSQLFCMDLADLRRRAKGRITFWGEIDRQHVMSATDPQVGRDAVRQVAAALYDPAGGIIAQFELGPGGNPAVAEAIFNEWEQITVRG